MYLGVVVVEMSLLLHQHVNDCPPNRTTRTKAGTNHMEAEVYVKTILTV